MSYHGFNQNLTFKKDELLDILRENRSEHASIVEEARDGYIAKAEAALKKRLEELKRGDIVSLKFGLRPPMDYTKDYDNAIRMLELCVEDEVKLSADEFRCFVQDEWEWISKFFYANRPYSMKAAQLLLSKRIEEDDY